MEEQINTQPPVVEQSTSAPIQMPESRDNKKAFGSVTVGLYASILFAIPFVSLVYPKLLELKNSSNVFVLFLIQLPMFVAGALNIVFFIIFLSIIARMIKHIRQKRGNFVWSVLAIVLNTIAFILLLVMLLQAGCRPGICF